MCALKQIWQNARDVRLFCKDPVGPDPSWKPVTTQIPDI